MGNDEIDTMKNDNATTVFSLDLVDFSDKHRQFLQYVHDLGVTRRVTTESLRRYRELWLPLVALSYDNDAMKQEQGTLLPPPDVAWLWHCHRLAPLIYERFIQEEFPVKKIKEESRHLPSILDLKDPQPIVAFSTSKESNEYTQR